MSQQTNLNVSPYFDDFDASNDYHRVLFKPGFPIQARELTGLQSILQNQVEKFGQHFFKEGAKVIPGNVSFNPVYHCVILNNTYNGVPVSAYAEQLVGTTITGQTSGVSAYVDKVLLPQESERGSLTLYINYLNSNPTSNDTDRFLDGESLSSNTTITSGLLGNTFINSGNVFGTTIDLDCNQIGTYFAVDEGVYFIRGNFVNVNKESLILSQYTLNPSFRIGFFINEQVVNSDIDESLNDNSQGFNNYSSPGADRLKISVSLFKKSLTDLNDNNFIEIAKVRDGVLTDQRSTTSDYAEIQDFVAKRTYAESGDYYVKPFTLKAFESLNDGKGNGGLFSAEQPTYSGSTPTENIGTYKISPGRAFIKGYDIETLSPTFLDFSKPRTTRTISDQAIPYNTGKTSIVHNIYGNPTIGIGNTYVLSLRDSRRGSTTTAPGKEIGLARLYDFRLESGSYELSNSSLNQWASTLYDVQPYTEVTLNQSTTLEVPTFVEGGHSGAKAFIRYPVSSGTLVTLYDVSGQFVKNEPLIFNGIEDGRVSLAVTTYSISNVKSFYGTDNGVVGAGTFMADLVQIPKYNVGVVSITGTSGNISTVTTSSAIFPSIARENDIVSFSNFANSDILTFAKINSIGTNSIIIEPVESVSGIASGSLPIQDITVSDFQIVSSRFENSLDDTLYTKLPKRNISNVDLTDAQLTIRKSFSVTISSGQLQTAVTAGQNESFLPFDEERYTLILEDGSTETLTADKFDFGVGQTTCQILNLSGSGSATLVATLKKVNPKAKEKIKNRVNTLVIDKSKYVGSGVGTTTLNDGLSYGKYPFGTRVQDNLLSLNVPDVIEIHGIFESDNNSAASAPKATLTSIVSPSSTTQDFVIGETITGQTSGAIAICAEKVTDSQITFLYKNGITFKEGETVRLSESGATATLLFLDFDGFDITSNYKLDEAQKDTFYDYSRLKRNNDSSEPTKQLKIYFSNGFYNSNDDGDITTVNSYNTFDYTDDRKIINNTSTFDIVDIRPRVSSIITSEEDRSPLEFLGRSFNASGNSSQNILASDESLILSYSYYLGRIDRIFLSKSGQMQVKFGKPADKPEKPLGVDESIEIATVTLPPYLFDISDLSIKFLDYKRFRMSDIKKLEDRVNNLEYYTTLSLLELSTESLFVSDNDGSNRFKSGFFVDNFTSFLTQDVNFGIRNSIDPSRNELRPQHYTNAVDLIFGPVITQPSEDLSFNTIEGNNIRRQNGILTLDYAEVEWLNQPFGTRTESVTPFLLAFWEGSLQLTPETDTWVDTARLDALIIDVEGDYASTFDLLTQTGQIDPQTGFGEIVWGSWQINWTGETFVRERRTRNSVTRNLGGRLRETTTTRSTFEDTIEIGINERQGTRLSITERFDQTSVGDRVVSRDVIPTMRSRNIQFDSRKLKPFTLMYPFFDGVNVSRYCFPKLLEISMESGVFEVGETVSGQVIQTGISEVRNAPPSIRFRVAQSNHKEGPFNVPSRTFRENPYTNTPLSANYSSTSTILNVDTLALSDQAQGEYFGYVERGMQLVGQTSGARATITDVRLIPDLSATLIGSFFIEDPNSGIHPRFETGEKTFRLTSDSRNEESVPTTFADDKFISSGTLETVQENIVSVRNAELITETFEQQNGTRQRTIDSELVSQDINVRLWTVPPPPPPPPPANPPPPPQGDPLAQTFIVPDTLGIFLTRVDVFFTQKDNDGIPVVVQLRTVENGTPTGKVIPFSEVVVEPDQVTTSDDGSLGTAIQFKAPVYLEPQTEYCVVLLSNSVNYRVAISRVGETDLITDEFISNQELLGSLFKSQNGSTWEPSQWEDLKFILYRADFLNTGSVELYNPTLSEGNGQIPTLLPNSLTLQSRKERLELTTTLSDSGYVFGNTFSQPSTNSTGNLVGVAGTAVGNLTISNPGIGYTPSIGSLTFSNTNLLTVTGNGRGATADITISSGVAVAATIANGGSGYQVGDVLEISTIGSNSIGDGARFTVAGIGGTSEIVLDNIQGEFTTGAGNTIFYTNSLGVTTELNYSAGGNVLIDSKTIDSDGLHIKVNHKNHGMYFNDNYVEISGVQPDIKSTKLTTSYSADSSEPFSVENAGVFSTFEGVGVGTTNSGYLLIGEEVIQYTSVSGNTIGGNIVRGNVSFDYPVGTPVYKYELGGVNLKRINKTHYLNDVTINNPIKFDSYHIKLDMSNLEPDNDDRSDNVGYPKLFVNQTKSAGGYQIKASQNMPFEVLTPNVHYMTVTGTNITSEVRTITSQSLTGQEVPYLDNGFEDVSLNEINYLETPRLIASKVNEQNQLGSIPNSKSLNMRLLLSTTDTRISPVIDTQRISVITTSNRVDSIITDYATDQRVNLVETDPTSCQYVTKEIVLENPATSLKMFIGAHINEDADIRAFYAIGNSSKFRPIFIPFPGYSNLDNQGNIISLEKNNGESDVFIPKTNSYEFVTDVNSFREYTFTADNLPSFRNFRIKFVLTSTNQVYVPKVRDLRVIALA